MLAKNIVTTSNWEESGSIYWLSSKWICRLSPNGILFTSWETEERYSAYYHIYFKYLTNQDLCEAFNWAYDAKFDPEALNSNELSINIRPDSIPGYKETLFKHHTKMLAFSHKMTRIFALALHLDESAFDAYIKRLEAGMRILHYPQQEASAEDQNKIGAHTLISNVSPPSRKTTVAASKSFLNLEIG